MTTFVRAVAALLTTPVLVAPVVFAPPAAAEPKPGLGVEWPMCGASGETDGFYCVESVTRNGTDWSTPPDPGPDGDSEDPYIDLIGDGDIRFGVYHWHTSGGMTTLLGDVDPSATWEWTVNTGTINPVEMYGRVRDPQLSFGGNATTGYTFTLSLKPTPIAEWWDYSVDPPTPFVCGYEEGCGTDATVATLVYNGFVTGYVTDDASSGLPAAQIPWHRGYVNAYNAQSAYWFYDFDTNAMVVRLANPHLKAAGVLATGYYETFIPDAMLINEYSVPDPTTLSTGSFFISRTGSSAPVPFTVTREPGGIRIKLTGITFSTPEYRIKPKASPPGAPRWGSLRRPTPTSARVSFRAPLADGGRVITGYAVRCTRGSLVWNRRVSWAKPVVFRGLPKAPVTCKVRAENVKGWGRWSTTKTG